MKIEQDVLLASADQQYEGKVVSFVPTTDPYGHFTGYVDEDEGKMPVYNGGKGRVLHTKGDCAFYSQWDVFKPGDVITFNIQTDREEQRKTGKIRPLGINPALKV